MDEDDETCSGKKGQDMEHNEMEGDLEAISSSNYDLVEEGEEATQPLLSKNVALPSSIPEQPTNTNQRLASLDVFRGLTVVAMILVDYGGGIWWGINHAPWNGVTFADFVVPAFLFIVGVSLALTYKTLISRRNASCNIILRVFKLFGLGLILQGGYLHGVKDLSYGVDIQHMRIMGVLQRISIAYVIVAFFEICSSRENIRDANESFLGIVKAYFWQWVAAVVLICLYAGLLYGLYVPDWQFEAPADPSSVDTNVASANISLLQVQCDVRGNISPACNAVSFVDRSILGISHLYRHPAYRRTKECSVDSPYDGPLPEDAPAWCLAPFDPEGLLSSLPAVVTCFIGAHYGHILLLVKDHKRRLWQWTTTGTVLIFVGLVLEIAGMPLNKQLYTLSYMFVTGGAVALAFVITYVLVDVYNWRSSTVLFKWVGAHSLLIYALFACGVLPIALQGFYWKSPQNNLIQIILSSLGF